MRHLRTDVAIIGGGLVGCWTAYFFRRRGVAVTLLDKGEIGAQSSGVNFGNLRLQGRYPGQIPLALRAHHEWERSSSIWEIVANSSKQAISTSRSTWCSSRSSKAWLSIDAAAASRWKCSTGSGEEPLALARQWYRRRLVVCARRHRQSASRHARRGAGGAQARHRDPVRHARRHARQRK
jgi:glycine/D-amino acid oxidase-like deaminating enzyme